MLVPVANAVLKNAGVSKEVEAFLDTGLQKVHLKLPASMAKDLGLKETGKFTYTDGSGRHEVPLAKIDLISIPGAPKCELANGIAAIDGDTVWIGVAFLSAVGARIVYLPEGTGLVCSGAGASIGVYPEFSALLSNKGKTLNETVILDSGFNGGVAVPEKTAASLGMEKGKETIWTTHTGKMKMWDSRVDRVAIGNCVVENANALIVPQDSTIQKMLVGEAFLNKVTAVVGYDKEGAFLACKADPRTKIRAVKTNYYAFIPTELLPDSSKPTLLAKEGQDLAWLPWAAGALAAGGFIYWLATKD